MRIEPVEGTIAVEREPSHLYIKEFIPGGFDQDFVSGLVELTFLPTTPSFVVLTDIAVSRTTQGTGVGSRLLTRACRWMDANGLSCWLHADGNLRGADQANTVTTRNANGNVTSRPVYTHALAGWFERYGWELIEWVPSGANMVRSPR